jgi:hypothetical protein
VNDRYVCRVAALQRNEVRLEAADVGLEIDPWRTQIGELAGCNIAHRAGKVFQAKGLNPDRIVESC